MCCFWIQNRDFWTGITSLYVSQTSPVILCMHYSVISTRNTCLNVSQPLSLVFACDFWSRITSLYGSQTSSVVCGGKTATFGPEYQISMGPRYDLSFCACKTLRLAPEILVSKGPSPDLRFCAFKRATFGAELQYSMGPRLHLWFLQAKQRILD